MSNIADRKQPYTNNKIVKNIDFHPGHNMDLVVKYTDGTKEWFNNIDYFVGGRACEMSVGQTGDLHIIIVQNSNLEDEIETHLKVSEDFDLVVRSNVFEYERRNKR